MTYSLAGKSTSLLLFPAEEHFLLPQNAFYLIDANIASLYPQLCGILPHKYIFSASEDNKSLTSASAVFSWLLSAGAHRRSIIFALGGGITCDLAGWVAANYMRGCRLFLLPTSLIAMIDAAWGGKNALNFADHKNLIGSFYPAEEVWLDPKFLLTLPSSHFRSGMAEIIKTALIQNGNLLQYLLLPEWHSPQLWQKILTETIDFKMSLCQKDPFDYNERRLLNLGHTFAHVLESALAFSIDHGRAVAIGIAAAARLSFSLNLISLQREQQILNFLKNFFPTSYFSIDKEEFARIESSGEAFFRHDKKAAASSQVVLFSSQKDVSLHSGISWQQMLEAFIDNKNLEV